MTTVGPKILPILRVYQNLDLDRYLSREKGTFDWTEWTTIAIDVPAIDLTLSKATSDIVVQSADQIKILFRTSAYGTKTPGTYRWQLTVGLGGVTVPVPVGEGTFVLLPAVS